MILRPLNLLNIKTEREQGSRPLLEFALISLAYLLLSLLLTSCAQHQSSNSTTLHHAGSTDKRILVVNTNNTIERYNVSQNTFTQTLSGTAVGTPISVRAIDLSEDRHPAETLQDLLNQQPYDAIYCIGAKALGSIDYLDPDIPVVFSSVLNWRRFIDQPRYFGVASEVAPAAQLTMFKYFFPQVRKIGVLYSSDNQTLIEDASLAADQLSIQVVAEKLTSESNLIDQAEKLLPNVDALWLISDSAVLASTSHAEALFQSANQHRTPVFAYNPVFIEMGAVLSISADVPTTGRQAALTIRNLLDNDTQQTPVQFPAGSSISLNLGKVHHYGMSFNNNALDSVNEILGE